MSDKIKKVTGVQDNSSLDTKKVTGVKDNSSLDTKKVTGVKDNSSLDTKKVTGVQDNSSLDTKKVTGVKDNSSLDTKKVTGVKDNSSLDTKKVTGELTPRSNVDPRELPVTRKPKSDKNIQVYKGGKSGPSLAVQHANDGCCEGGLSIKMDKLPSRVRFGNSLAHLNPTGGNEKFLFSHRKHTAEIIEHFRNEGVGASASILLIPTYARVTDVAVSVGNLPEGITLKLVFRNIAPTPEPNEMVGEKITVISKTACETLRKRTGNLKLSNTVFKALPSKVLREDYFFRSGNNNGGIFMPDADELMLVVVSMNDSELFTDDWDLNIAVSYDSVMRAEY